jgi:hypothetical protein
MTKKLTKDQLESITEMDTIRFQTVKGIQAIGNKASHGHYLDRMIAICTHIPCVSRYLVLFQAYKAYAEDHGKPPQVDKVMYLLSCELIEFCKESEVPMYEIAKIVWGLDFDALCEHNLVHLRSKVKGN